MRRRSCFWSLALLGSTMAIGCGASAPTVDPHPLYEGGLADRILLEASASDSADGADAAAADSVEVDATVDLPNADGGDSAGEGGAIDDDSGTADGSSDGPLIATMVSVDVTAPLENGLQVATTRFAPTVAVVLTTDQTRSDDIKDVNVELWSTGALPAKISTTKLSRLSKTGGGAAPTDGGADASVEKPPGESTEALFNFGDTPIDLTSLVTDTYELRAIATTLGGATASANRRVRVDAGPIIKVISPTPDQAARGSIFVSVQVTDPFSATPPTVTMSVANIRITPLTIVGDLYQATVAETIAMPPLSGEQLLDVAAVNAAGVTARHTVVRFVFDDIGPVITNGRPPTSSLIGGIVKLEADVTDAAGVDANSVVAVVAHGGTSFEVRLDQDPNDHKHYTHLFDTRLLKNTVLYPTISFRASDLPGNQSNIGYTVAVDNTPPLSDLDPPADLRLRQTATGISRCSWAFDPMGTDSVNDGDYVYQLFDIRARVEDQGNTPVAGGADITPLSGLDASHVELLALDDTSHALVVDTDGDGVCDAVNPKLVPTTTPMSSLDALLVNLAPVLPTGTADFTPDPSIPGGAFSDCLVGTATQSPLILCKTSDLTVAIPAHDMASPAVWTIPKVVPSSLQCVGNQLDVIGNHIGDGPACLVVHAIDQLKNAQVSRVVHICIDHDGNGAECPYAAVSSVQGGTPVRVDTPVPHGLVTGDRALLGAVPTLFDANGLWKVTVIDATSFTLNGSSTPSTSVAGGQFMRWTSASDCTGRQTALSPAVVDDLTPCRPWRAYRRGEHLDIN